MLAPLDEATRQQLEAALVCRCGAMNRPGIRPTVEIDDHGRVACNQCGRVGHVQDFRKEP